MGHLGSCGDADEAAEIAAIYLHCPFCFHKCHYCDFYSISDGPSAGDRQAAFIDRLEDELEFRAGQYRLRPRTIFVGGGTPTFLRPELLRKLFGKLGDLGAFNWVAEFTVEANPETVTPEVARILASAGVNRVSVGCQSFEPALLKALERWHEPASVARTIDQVRGVGITNINLDLIFAIPGQTMAMLDADLDAALALSPTHLSCYGLTYEPNTAMTRRLQLGQFRRAPEQLERDMYARIMARLDHAGFEHYEISSWARRDKGQGRRGEGANDPGPQPSTLNPSPLRCQHNMIYWTNSDWIGFGPSAASHVRGHRWKNDPHLGRYLAQSPQPPTVDHECLPRSRRTGEILMLALRLRDGVRLDWLKRHLSVDDVRYRVIDDLIEMNLLERIDTQVRLSNEGLFVADAVIERLL